MHPRVALGYACLPPEGAEMALRRERHGLATACRVRGLALSRVLHDRDGAAAGLDRPGLQGVMAAVADGDAQRVVVTGLELLALPSAPLGALVEWLEDHGAGLVVADIALDTASPAGRVTARALAETGRLARRRDAERTRRGLAAARDRGRPAVADRPELREHIARRRAEGTTLKAIADELNAAGVPTLRGGAMWRPSSVQTAAGYRRPSRPRSLVA